MSKMIEDELADMQAEGNALTEDMIRDIAEGKSRKGRPKLTVPDLEEKVADPREKEEWTFLFEHTDGRKKKWAGRFTNKILNIGDLQSAARVQATLLAGNDIRSFSGGMLEMMNAQAHMMISLKERPEWAKNLTAIQDTELFFALWRKVVSHETHYFRPGEATDEEDSGS